MVDWAGHDAVLLRIEKSPIDDIYDRLEFLDNRASFAQTCLLDRIAIERSIGFIPIAGFDILKDINSTKNIKQ